MSTNQRRSLSYCAKGYRGVQPLHHEGLLVAWLEKGDVSLNWYTVYWLGEQRSQLRLCVYDRDKLLPVSILYSS